MCPSPELALLCLRDHPFYPSVDKAGKPIAATVIRRDLKPDVDDRVLGYYFDIYDLKSSPIIGSFSNKHGFPNLPQANPDSPPLLIVCGTEQSGRDSLTNLLLYQVKRDVGEPFVIDCSFLDFDTLASAKTLRLAFARELSLLDDNPIEKRKSLEPLLSPDDDLGAVAESLRSLPLYFKKKLDGRPVVVRISGKEHYTLWTTAHRVLQRSASLVIVNANEPSLAKVAHDQVKEAKGTGAVFSLRLLTRDLGHRYVRERVSTERAGTAANEIFPFTPDAIDYLFDELPNATAHPKSARSILRSIGWVRDTLRYAIQEQTKELAVQVGMPIAIDRAKMKQYRERMNSGNFSWDN